MFPVEIKAPFLMRMSIDGGQPTQLTRGTSLNPQISPDGKQIAYLESSDSMPALHLAIMPFSGGPPEKVFPLPQRMPVNLARQMRWTPQGGALIYKDSLRGLWRQRLDEEKPQPIKGFENVLAGPLTWSFNGTTLSYTRKSEMQEILLLHNFR